MKIEDAIVQRKFKSEAEKMLINIMYTSSFIENYLQQVFKEKDVTLQQYNVLRILRGSMPKPLSTKTIRDRMIEKMSDTPKLVDRMAKKALVHKCVNEVDKRLVDVTITKKGLDILSYFDRRYDHVMSIIENLSENEAATVNSLLDKLRTGE